MGMEVDEELTMAALKKWYRGIPLSRDEFERIVSMIREKDLRVEMLDAPSLATLQVKFRSAIQERFLPKGE